jgi:hypothetical protein
MGMDDPTGGVILVLFIKHNIFNVLAWDGAPNWNTGLGMFSS